MNSLAEVELGMRWHNAVKLLQHYRKMFPSMEEARFQEMIGEDYDKTIRELSDAYKQLGLPVDQSVFLEIEVSKVCPSIRERYEKAIARRREQKAQGVDPRLSANSVPST